MLTREIQDPKLAVALDEISAVLARHKIAGAICVASSTHAAYRLSFPDWSAVQPTDEGVHITSSSERDGKEHLASSMHMLLSLRDLLLLHAKNMIDIADVTLVALSEQGVKVTHELFGDDDIGGTEQ